MKPDTNHNQSQYLSISQAANFLKVSSKTLRRWEAAGLIKPARDFRNQRIYHKEELLPLLNQKNRPLGKNTPSTVKTPIAPIKELSISAAAQELGVTPKTIRRWNEEGLIHSQRNTHNHRVFLMEEIDRVKSERKSGDFQKQQAQIFAAHNAVNNSVPSSLVATPVINSDDTPANQDTINEPTNLLVPESTSKTDKVILLDAPPFGNFLSRAKLGAIMGIAILLLAGSIGTNYFLQSTGKTPLYAFGTDKKDSYLDQILGITTSLGSNLSFQDVIDSNFNFGVQGEIEGSRFISSTNTQAPLIVNSTQRVTNLNADLLDGKHLSEIEALIGGSSGSLQSAYNSGGSINTASTDIVLNFTDQSSNDASFRVNLLGNQSVFYITGNSGENIAVINPNASNPFNITTNARIGGSLSLSGPITATGTLTLRDANTPGAIPLSDTTYTSLPGGTNSILHALNTLGGGGSSYWSDSGSIVYISNTGRNLAVGGSGSSSGLYFETSQNRLRIGSGSSTDGRIELFASDGDNGLLTYTTSDQFRFTSGDVVIAQNLNVEGGQITGANGERMNLGVTNGLISFVGTGGTNNTDIHINVDGTYPTIYSSASSSVGLDDNLVFVGARSISTSTGNLTLSPAGSLVLAGTNCSTYANGGVLTTTAGGAVICDDDDNSTLTVAEAGGSSFGDISTISYLGADFNVTNSPAGQANVSIDYANSSIARTNQAESISAGWNFNSGLTTVGLTIGGESFSDLTGEGLELNATSLRLASTTAGSGLSYAGGILNVGAGNGISVGATSVSVNLATNSGLNTTSGLAVDSSIAGSGLALSTGVLSIGAGNGISVGADNIAVTLASGSGLQFDSGNLSLLRTCSDEQILKWDSDTNSWICAADAGAGGGISGSGTIGAIPVFTGANSLGDSILAQAGNTLSLADGYELDVAGSFTLGGETFSTLTGDGLTLSGTDLAVNLAANSGLTFSTGALTINSSIAGTGLTWTNGVLDVTGITGSEVAADTLDWSHFSDTMTLDADTTIAAGAGTTLTFNDGTVLNVAGTLRVGGESFSDLSGEGLELSGNTLRLASTSAGNGLTYSTGVLAVGAGDGISVSANSIAVSLASGSGLQFDSGNLSLLRSCTDGQVLKWDNDTSAWICDSDAGAGDGITGSGTSGRIAVFTGSDSLGDSILAQAGNAISIADGYELNIAGSFTLGGETFSTLTGDGLELNGIALRLASTVGGNGLTYSSGVLAVGAGSGITVNANDIAINLATNSGLNTTSGLSIDSSIAGTGLTWTDGVLDVTGITGSEVANDTIDWAQISDTMTLDANTTIAAGAGSSLTFNDGTTLAVAGSFTLGGEDFSTLTGNGLELSGNALQLASTTAGDGLTYTSGVLDIGAGTGILVDSSNVSLNTNAQLTWSGNQTFNQITTGTLSLGGEDFSTLTGTGLALNGSDLSIDTTAALSWSNTQTFSDVDINGGDIDGTIIGANSAAAGTFTDLTANTSFTLGGEAFTTLTGNGLAINSGILGVSLESGSGLEFSSGNLSLLRSCSDGQLLEWDNDGSAWICGDPAVGTVTGGGTIGAIPVFTGAGTLGDSFLSQAGNAITVADGYELNVAGSFTLGSETFSTLTGNGLELDGTDLAINLAPNSGLTFSTGALTIDSSIAGTGLTWTDGVLDVTGITGSEVANDTIDWAQISDTMTLDANTTIAAGAGSSLTFNDGTTLAVAGSFTLGGEAFSTLTGDGLELSGNALQLASTTAGDGLTYTSGVLDIGAGTGILVDSSNVSLNTNAQLTWSGNQTFNQITTGTLSLGGEDFSTLTGSGLTLSGSDLAIDTTAALSWSNTQTFSDVDINGGDIDGTIIGANSAAAGTFTDLTAGTFTINSETFSNLTGTGLAISSGDLFVDTTQFGSTTWGSGSGFTWTFDTGATDPTIAFADDALTLTAGTVSIAGDLALEAGAYLNFDTTIGETGYGIRDNAGTIEFKDSGGSWNPLGSGGISNWDELGNPGDNLTLTMSTHNTTFNSSINTGTGFNFNFDSLTSGIGLDLASTSTNLTTGNLLNLDWSPGSATTATGDLLTLNIGSNGTIGNLLNITNNGSTLFRVSQAGIESALPHSFTAAGDVSMAYDLQFTNQTASYIKSKAPLYIESGEVFENNDLTLRTYGLGDFVFDNTGSPVLTIQSDGDIQLANNETIGNGTDDLITFSGVGGSDNTDIYFDLDGTHPVIYSNTDTAIEINDDLIVTGSLTLNSETFSNLTGDGLTLASGDLAVSLASGSGLEFDSGNLSLLRSCGDGQVLSWDDGGSEWVCDDASTGSIAGSGTTGYIPLFSDSTTLTNSILSQSGTTLAIADGHTFDVAGTFTLGGEAFSTLTGDGLELSGNALQLASTTAGDGLTYTSGVLDIGAGTGILVDSSNVSLNTNAQLTWSGNQTFNQITTGTLSLGGEDFSTLTGNGLELDGTNLAINLATNSGLDFSTNALTIDSNIAGTGLTWTDGVLDVSGITSAEIANDTIDWAQISDTMTLDANTTIAAGVGSSLTFNDGTTLAIAGTFTLGGEAFSTLTGTGLALSGSDLAFVSTEIDSTTWGSGSGFTWTFDAGATDPTFVFGSGTVDITADLTANSLTLDSGGITLQNGETIANSTDGLISFTDGTNNLFNIYDNGSEGRLAIGTDTPQETIDFRGSDIDIDLTTVSDTENTTWHIYRARDVLGSEDAVQAEDNIFVFDFLGYDGTDYEPVGYLRARVDGTPGNNDMPGRLEFAVTPDNSDAPVIQMTLKNNGALGLGTSAPDARLEINHSTGQNLRLTYNDSDGSAANYADFTMSSDGDLTIAPSGSDTNITGNLAVSADLAVNGGDLTSTATTFNFDIGNTGTLNFRDGTNALLAIKDQGSYAFLNFAGKSDTGNPASCTEGDTYYNAFDNTFNVCTATDTWTDALAAGGGASNWNDLGNPTGNLSLTMGTHTTTFGSSMATGTAFTYNFNSLSSGTGLSLASTSTDLTTGKLFNLDWSPDSATTATGDLLSLNIGSNGTIGNIFNVQDNGSSVFKVSQTQITSALPHSFTAAGDVSIAYDLQFTNSTASFIKSNAPLAIESGETFNSSNLTFKTYNAGNIVFDIPSSGAAIFQGAVTLDTQATLPDNTTPSVAGNSHFVEANSTNRVVTNFTNGKAGQVIVIEATTSNLDFDCTSNANFNCGNADITMADGGVATWIYSGTVWNMISYMNSGTGGGNDIAELFPSSETLEAGDVVSIDTTQPVTIRKAQPGDDETIVGIVSTQPGITLGDAGENKYPVALVGRVPVKINPSSAAINKGDLIGASSLAGTAQKVTHGYIIGKALESWNPGDQHPVTVFVSGYYKSHADVYITQAGDLNLPGSATIAGNLTVNGTNILQELNDNTANIQNLVSDFNNLSALTSTNTANIDTLTTNYSQLASDFASQSAAFQTQALGVGTAAPASGSGKLIDTSSGAYLSEGGVWTNVSDVNRKHNFLAVNSDVVLDGILNLDITTWNYKNQSDSIRHMGPTAQDFYSIFGLGANNTSISTIDTAGVAFAGIKGLNTKVNTLHAQIVEQMAQNQEAQPSLIEQVLATLLNTDRFRQQIADIATTTQVINTNQTSNLINPEVSVQTLEVEGEIQAQEVVSEQVTTSNLVTYDIAATNATFGALLAETINAATVSAQVGEFETLRAGQIEGLDDKIDNRVNGRLATLEQRIAEFTALQASQSSESAHVADTTFTLPQATPANQDTSSEETPVELPESTITITPAQSFTDYLAQDDLSSSAFADIDALFVGEFLAVQGTASIVNADVTAYLTVGSNLLVDKNSLSTLDEETLYLQPAGGKLNLLAGLIELNGDGTVRVNGDLFVSGRIAGASVDTNKLALAQDPTASDSARANLNLSENADLEVRLATASALVIRPDVEASTSATTGFGSLAKADLGATITASGSAEFATLTIRDNSGKATIQAGRQGVIIQPQKLTASSQVIVTFEGDFSPATRYWITKDTEAGAFSIQLDKPVGTTVQAYWLIIN